MDKNNVIQLQKILGTMASAKIMTADDIEQILKGVMQIMNSFKSGNEALNTETKKSISSVLEKIKEEKKEMDSNIELSKSIISTIKNIKSDIEKVIASGIKNGEPGKDADEEYIIQELAKLIPPPQEIKLDDGEQLIKKINEAKEGKIKASQISDLPKFTREVIHEVGARAGAYETPLKNASTGKLIPKDTSGAYLIQNQSGTLIGTWAEEYPASGVVDGANKIFVFAHTPSFLSLEGQALSILNGDYTVVGNTVTLTSAPIVNPPVNKYLI